MTLPITELQLENAAADALTLEAVVNGPPSPDVISRLSRALKPLSYCYQAILAYIAGASASQYTGIGAIDMYVVTPPGSPATGDTYLLGYGCTDAWAGHDDTIAIYGASSWSFLPLHDGIVAYVKSCGCYAVRNGGSWDDPSSRGRTYKRQSSSMNTLFGYSQSNATYDSHPFFVGMLDSLTDGTDTQEDSWRKQFVKIARAVYGDGGPGYLAFDFGVATDQNPGGFAKSSGFNYIAIDDGIYGGVSVDGKGIYTGGSASGQTASWIPASRWDNCRLFYWKQSGGGTFKVKAYNDDDANKITVNTYNATGTIGYVDIPFCKLGTINGLLQDGIAITDAGANIVLFGCMWTINNRGALFGNFALGGRTLQNVAAQAQTTRTLWFEILTPTHVFINGGMNDRVSRTAAQHYTDLESIVYAIKAASTNIGVSIVQSLESSDAATTHLNSYYQSKIAICKNYLCGLLDLRREFGNYPELVARGLMHLSGGVPDGIHPGALLDIQIGGAHAEHVGLPVNLPDPGPTPYIATYYGSLFELAVKKGYAVYNTSKPIFNLGLTNGSPTMDLEIEVHLQRDTTGSSMVRKFNLVVNNGNTDNYATGVSGDLSGVLVRAANNPGDGGLIDCALTAAIGVDNHLLIGIKPNVASFNGNFTVRAKAVFPYRTTVTPALYDNLGWL